MGIPCYNSICEAEYAHQQGLESEREMWIERETESVLERLNDGDSVCIGNCSYSKDEILAEEMTPYDFKLLAQAHTLGDKGAAHMKELNGRLDQILTEWVDRHIEDILMAEAPDDYSDYEDAA